MGMILLPLNQSRRTRSCELLGRNPKRPVSDKEIVEELARSHIHIARRTVAKYRDLLGIAPSSRRKKKF